jgi:hypothetical protein
MPRGTQACEAEEGPCEAASNQKEESGQSAKEKPQE